MITAVLLALANTLLPQAPPVTSPVQRPLGARTSGWVMVREVPEGRALFFQNPGPTCATITPPLTRTAVTNRTNALAFVYRDPKCRGHPDLVTPQRTETLPAVGSLHMSH